MATNRPDSLDSRLKSFLAEARHILSTGGVTPVNLAKVKKAGEKQGLTDEQRDAAVEDLIRTHPTGDLSRQSFKATALPSMKQ